MRRVRVKVCCIGSVEEARLAIKYGASAIGLVGKMPSGPGPISDELIRSIALSLPPAVSSFLLTSEVKAESIIAHIRRANTQVVQLVDNPEPNTYERIRELLPHIKIVQVIHILNEKDIERAAQLNSRVDGILLDSGNPNLTVKELGGTGKTHNWQISRAIVQNSPVPVFLAGGLNHRNVREAINTVHPFGVDVCSGVRENGALSEKLLREFFEAVKAGIEH